jgi:hypothetical protein
MTKDKRPESKQAKKQDKMFKRSPKEDQRPIQKAMKSMSIPAPKDGKHKKEK